MTKEEFYLKVIKPTKQELIEKKEGVYLHLKHCFDNNNAKSIFEITGLDFSAILKNEQGKLKLV
jgi:hypothetical protein